MQAMKIKSWLDGVIFTIADLINNNHLILNRHGLALKYNVSIKFMDYCTIIDAIPTEWKCMIKNHVYKTHAADVVTGHVVKLEEKYNLITELKCKDFYKNFIRRKFKRPTRENTWQEKKQVLF